eukprot:EG_transcript_1514
MDDTSDKEADRTDLVLYVHRNECAGSSTEAAPLPTTAALLAALSFLGDPSDGRSCDVLAAALKEWRADGKRPPPSSEFLQLFLQTAPPPPPAPTSPPRREVWHMEPAAALAVLEGRAAEEDGLLPHWAAWTHRLAGQLGPFFAALRQSLARRYPAAPGPLGPHVAVEQLSPRPCLAWTLPMVHQDHRWLEGLAPLALSPCSPLRRQPPLPAAAIAAWGRHLVLAGHVDAALRLCTTAGDLQVTFPILLQVLSAPACPAPLAAASIQQVMRLSEPPVLLEGSPSWSKERRHPGKQEAVRAVCCGQEVVYILTGGRLAAFSKDSGQLLRSEELLLEEPAALAVVADRVFFFLPTAPPGSVLVELDASSFERVGGAGPDHPINHMDPQHTTLFSLPDGLYVLAREAHRCTVSRLDLAPGKGLAVAHSVALTASASPPFQPDRLKALRTSSQQPLRADLDVRELPGFTIEVWARVEAMEITPQDNYIWRLTDGGKEVKLGFGETGVQLVSSLLGMEVCVSCPFVPSTWCHYAATVDERGRWMLWCNGTVQGCTSTEPAFKSAGRLAFSAKTLHIGAFEGALLELRLWRGSRPAFELAAHWQRSVDPSHPCLLCYWPLVKQFGDWVLDRKGFVPPREVPDRPQSKWVRCDSPLAYLEDRVAPGDASNALHLLDGVLGDVAEARVSAVGLQLRLRRAQGAAGRALTFSLTTGSLLDVGPPSRALDCPRSCLDPAAGGYWVYHPAEDRVSFEALPELMAAKLRVAAHIARLGESLAAEAALGVQSHHCAWALLHFAAFMADCQKVDAGTLYKHWAIDVAPETLCMLAQTLSNSLAKGFAAAPSQPPPSMPSPGVPQPTAAPLPSDAMAQTFVDVLLRLFAANFAQLGAVQEACHVYRFQHVDTLAVLAALTALLTTHAMAPGSEGLAAALNVAKVVHLLVQAGLTVEEKVDAVVRILSATEAVPLGEACVLRECLESLATAPAASQAVDYLAQLSAEATTPLVGQLLGVIVADSAAPAPADAPTAARSPPPPPAAGASGRPPSPADLAPAGLPQLAHCAQAFLLAALAPLQPQEPPAPSPGPIP